jgi:hypothetical protein
LNAKDAFLSMSHTPSHSSSDENKIPNSFDSNSNSGIVRAHAFFLETVHCSFNRGRKPAEALTDFVESVLDNYVRGMRLEVRLGAGSGISAFPVTVLNLVTSCTVAQALIEAYMLLDSSGTAFGRSGVLGPAGFRLTSTEVHYRGKPIRFAKTAPAGPLIRFAGRKGLCHHLR